MGLKKLGAHLQLRLIQLLKEPGYVVSTLVFPALFFLIFALPNADTAPKARFLLGSFSAFAVLGVCFFQFGVQHALEIRSGWFAFVRTLPAREWHRVAAQWLGAWICAFLSALAVYMTIRFSTDLDIELSRWLWLVLVLMVASMPFALFSAALAVFVGGAAALPVFNLIYILSSFAGGLWLPPNALPSKVELVSRYLPTRHLGEVVWKVALGEAVEVKYVLFLGAFGALSFALLWLTTKFESHLSRC